MDTWTQSNILENRKSTSYTQCSTPLCKNRRLMYSECRKGCVPCVLCRCNSFWGVCNLWCGSSLTAAAAGWVGKAETHTVNKHGTKAMLQQSSMHWRSQESNEVVAVSSVAERVYILMTMVNRRKVFAFENVYHLITVKLLRKYLTSCDTTQLDELLFRQRHYKAHDSNQKVRSEYPQHQLVIWSLL
jgi:hypothetical protein